MVRIRITPPVVILVIVVAAVVLVLLTFTNTEPSGRMPSTPSTPTISHTEQVHHPQFQTCDEARAAGRTNIPRGDPDYTDAMDHDGDGIACESNE